MTDYMKCPAETINSNESSSSKDEEIVRLRAQLSRSNARLSCISEGMRLLAAQIRQADLTAHPIKKIILTDDQTISTECDATVVSEEESNRASSSTCSTQSVDPTETRLCEITDELSQSQTADLLALQNAAHMLQEHARLSSQEAALSVRDAVQAQGSLEEWKRRAVQAERKNAKLAAENQHLKAQNEKLAAERRVLIKEVRKLRKVHDEKQDYWGQLESYFLGALNMHEQNLKKNQQLQTDDEFSASSNSDEGALVTVKTDTAVHVESDPTPTPAESTSEASSTPQVENSAPDSTTCSDSTSAHSNGGSSGQKFSFFGESFANRFGRANRAMRQQVQRRLSKTSADVTTTTTTTTNTNTTTITTTTTTSESPTEELPVDRIDMYPGDCVSPSTSYDSVAGSCSIDDSDHSSKSSSTENQPDVNVETPTP